jgi:predicted amidohydrolase YtcJ
MTVFSNAAVLTMDPRRPEARVLGVGNGRIVHLDDRVPPELAAEPMVDLSGRAIIPLAVDSHLHFTSYALFISRLFVYDAEDVSSLLDMIGAHAAQGRGAILGFGASPWALEEKRLPTRPELDQVTAGRPLFLVKYDGHSALVNSAMLQDLPPQVAAERGYLAETGLIEAEAFYLAAKTVTEKVSKMDITKNVLATAQAMARQGFGLIHAVEGVGFKKDLDVTGLMKLAKGLPLETRVFFQTLDVDRVKKLKLPRVGGCFACALDGAPGTHDIALHEPFTDDPDDRGILFYEQEVVDEFVDKAHRAGLQVEMHAIGDRAVTQAVDAFEKAITKNPRDDHRHTIIHAFLVTERDKDRMAELGIGVATQPSMLTLRQEPPESIEKILGDRIQRTIPIKSLVDRGIRVSFGSDAPVTLPSLAGSINAAVNHPNPAERVDVTTALALHTRAGFETTFDEGLGGRLAEGLPADFLVLNADPRQMTDLTRLEVEQVYRAGRPVTENAGGLASLMGQVIKGFLSGRKI